MSSPPPAPSSRTRVPRPPVPRPRVLFVGAFPPPGSNVFGGNVSASRALLASSFARRLDLTLLDTTQQSVPPPPLAVRARLAAARVVRFARLLVTARPEAVLVFASGGLSFAEKATCCALAAAAGRGTVLSIRDGFFMDACRRSAPFRTFARAMLRPVSRVLCQGPKWHRFYVDELGLAPEKCPIVENWTAGAPLLRIGEARGERAADVPVHVLFVGWMERFKGVFELLDAFAHLSPAPDAPPPRLTLAGDGGAMGEARAHAAALGIADRVTFAGWVRGEALERLYADADVFALPSYAEGLPNAMVEAMAAGLPVVVTPVGSVPDVVTDGAEGRLVPPRDAAALEAALRPLVADGARRRTMGAAGHALARARFGAEPAAERLAALLTEVAHWAPVR